MRKCMLILACLVLCLINGSRNAHGASAKNSRSNFGTFGSFPIRVFDKVKWLVDGKAYMSAVADALEAAQSQIMIAGWWITPEIHLKRDPGNSDKWRLDKILQRKAQANVTTHVLVWWEPQMMAAVQNSKYTLDHLTNLHPNIKVLRHGDHVKRPFWAHHEKIVVVDKEVAFVGGLDLAYGRWDDEHHRLFDQIQKFWRGKDYANFYVKDVVDPHRPEEENFNRNDVPRLPWHDIAAMVKGKTAEDVAQHFIQRWNKAWPECCSSFSSVNTLLLSGGGCGDKKSLRCKEHCSKIFGCDPYKGFDMIWKFNNRFDETGNPTHVQLLRSITDWSAGLRTETSIQSAYIELINRAKHYIYIENQFFISTIPTAEGKYVANRINEALLARILLAHKNKENFRVYIVIPLLPGFQKDTAEIEVMLFWTYRSISNGARSLLLNLHGRIGNDMYKYVTFCSLRTWSLMTWKQPHQLVTQPIYIHSKTVIVDDRYTIIGSANINDRSQLGERDSEVALYIEDALYTNSKMNGRPYQSGEFSGSLRRQLFNEHLGQLENVNTNGQLWPKIDVTDPVSDEFFQIWNDIAKNNTAIYEQAFPGVAPSNQIRTLQQWQDHQRKPKRGKRDTNDLIEKLWEKVDAADKPQGADLSTAIIYHKLSSFVSGFLNATDPNFTMMKGIRGHLVAFPTKFLSEEKLPKSQYSIFDKPIYTF